jgi:tetratricopeptide (TPR) repeat protein
LQSDVEWALERGLGNRDLVPMLERLLKHAPRGSSAACFAGTELAEVLLQTEPWRAAALSREVLVYEETDRAWAVLGLGLMMLGHYRAAKRAFAKALALAPGCSSYAHNLGHLLDAALNRPREALPWLEQALAAHPYDAELAASYAHALVRVGRAADARSTLERAMGETPGAVDALLARWGVASAVPPSAPVSSPVSAAGSKDSPKTEEAAE